MTPKTLVFLGVLGLADCTPGREPRSVAASSTLRSFVGWVTGKGPTKNVCHLSAKVQNKWRKNQEETS